MTTTPTSIRAEEARQRLTRDVRRRRGRVDVRRVAAIRPEGAHFAVRPLRAWHHAARD
jgi:hypothetical protein